MSNILALKVKSPNMKMNTHISYVHVICKCI